MRVETPDERRRALGFDFLKPPRSGRDVLVAEGLSIRAGDKQLLVDTSFAIERGEHVALVGPNGSGKTTLLETILGQREPARGKVRLGHGVEVAYFSQHEAELDERGSVLDAAMSGTGLKRPDAQNLLGRFLFSGWDEHEKPVAVLSGGERRRLALAIVVASGANFLVLDEPTNHLDLESRESLEIALEAFPGTVLLVSHDRALLDAVASRLLAVEDQGIVSFPGGWADYARAQAEDAAPGPVATPARSEGREAAEARKAETDGRSSSSSWRSRAPRSALRRSSRSSRQIGATSRCWPLTATPAKTWPSSSHAGKACSRKLRRRYRTDATARIDSSVIGSSTRIASSAPAAASASRCAARRRAGIASTSRGRSPAVPASTSTQALRSSVAGSRPARSAATVISALCRAKPSAVLP